MDDSKKDYNMAILVSSLQNDIGWIKTNITELTKTNIEAHNQITTEIRKMSGNNIEEKVRIIECESEIKDLKSKQFWIFTFLLGTAITALFGVLFK
jgi:hypothetical protein